MSSDNGVYLLVTKKGDGVEYRVAEMGAVDNIDWCEVCDSSTPPDAWCNTCQKFGPCNCDRDTCAHDKADVNIKNAREMWANSTVYTDEMIALREAMDILNSLMTCEYGISKIEIDREF